MALAVGSRDDQAAKGKGTAAGFVEMRDAIDRYKDAADRGGFQTKADSFNYPPDLDALVKGVDVQGKKIRFFAPAPR